jgi:hypothetical protein
MKFISKFHQKCQYTLSIITSQLHCFKLRTTLTGKDFKGFFLMGYAQRSRTSFFNTCIKNNSSFWPINVEISISTKTRPDAPPDNLEPRVKAYFHIYWSKSKICFHVLKKDVLLLCIAHEKKNVNSSPFKVVLSWKQCSCDIIIEHEIPYLEHEIKS